LFPRFQSVASGKFTSSTTIDKSEGGFFPLWGNGSLGGKGKISLSLAHQKHPPARVNKRFFFHCLSDPERGRKKKSGGKRQKANEITTEIN